jgi:hypothetical protein
VLGPDGRAALLAGAAPGAYRFGLLLPSRVAPGAAK